MDNAVTLYTGRNCPYCLRAKKLLTSKGIPFKEIDIALDPGLEKEMIRITGKMTVPQILIHGTPIGGCDDLYELERQGELDRLLNLG